MTVATVERSALAEVMTETNLPVIAGPDNITRARLLVRALKIATPELGLRAQAEKDGPGSKTWAQIAAEFGCSADTLDRARSAAGLKTPRSRASATAETGDLDPDAEIVEAEIVLDGQSTAEFPPDPGIVDAEIVDDPSGKPEATDCNGERESPARAIRSVKLYLESLTYYRLEEKERRSLVNALIKALKSLETELSEGEMEKVEIETRRLSRRLAKKRSEMKLKGTA